MEDCPNLGNPDKAFFDFLQKELLLKNEYIYCLQSQLQQAERVLREIQNHPHTINPPDIGVLTDIGYANALGIAEGHRRCAALAAGYFAGREEWKTFSGIPPADVVKRHETQHPRKDGVRLNRITLDRLRPGNGSQAEQFESQYIPADDWSFGDWMCQHLGGVTEPYLSALRLKEVNGEVVYQIGFTGWMRLSDAKWANECRYFPVTQEGFPALVPPVEK